MVTVVLHSVFKTCRENNRKRSEHYWDNTQCRVVIPYRHYGTTYWSHL